MHSEQFKWRRNSRHIYCFADSLPLCRKLLDGGARIIQLRAKNLEDGAFRQIAREMQALLRSHPEPTMFIVNDRVEIAFEIGADGLHVGQDDSDYRTVIAEAPPGMSIGVSVGSASEAKDAQRAGADYVGAGAVFPTATKEDAEYIGLDGLREVVASVSIPVVAIGGITLENVALVTAAGADYIAVISAVNQAADIGERLKLFSDRVNPSYC